MTISQVTKTPIGSATCVVPSVKIEMKFVENGVEYDFTGANAAYWPQDFNRLNPDQLDADLEDMMIRFMRQLAGLE